MTAVPDGETAHPLDVPYQPDPVLGPTVVYGDLITAVYYSAEDGTHVRVTFEALNAIKVSRGEIIPYAVDWSVHPEYSAVYVVDNSKWLRERHAYEEYFYRNSYDNSLVTNYQHYVLAFHDQFAEILAEGIWFEHSNAAFDYHSFPDDHPFNILPESAAIDQFSIDDILCQIRMNSKPVAQILRDSSYCSQTLYALMIGVNGTLSLDHTLKVRVRDNVVQCLWINVLGKIERRFSAPPTRADITALAVERAHEVLERRRNSAIT